jgi:hypothetical protein
MLFRFHQQSLGLINGIFATSLGTVVMSNNIGALAQMLQQLLLVIPLMGFILLVLEGILQFQIIQ